MPKVTICLLARLSSLFLAEFILIVFLVLPVAFTTPVVSAQSINTEFEGADASVADYVVDRHEATTNDRLLEYSQAHPEVVDEYHHQVTDSDRTVEQVPPPNDTFVEGKMRSDLLPMPSDIDPKHADNVEIQEAQGNSRARAFSASSCEAIWPTGFQVCGAILEAYRAIGGPLSWLGPPKSNELTNPDGVGKRTEFYGGSIYWHPDTGAHPVTLDGMRQWGTLRWEAGPLGYPNSAPIALNIPLSQMQRFQGGDNYYSPLTGGAVWGDIKNRYDELGGSHHAIGIPITNELKNGEKYRYSNFSNGTITWRDDRQTRFMYLATQRVWNALGRESGRLGWPATDELAYIPGKAHHVDFDRDAMILWGAGIGAREINGEVVRLWNQLGGFEGLGLPLLSTTSFEDSVLQRFERGVAWATNDGVAYMEGNNGSRSVAAPATENGPLKSRAVTDESNLRITRANGTADIVYSGGHTSGSPYIVRRGYYDQNDVPGVGFGADKAQYKHGFTRWDMAEAAFGSSASHYFSPSEPGAEGWETEIKFVSCVRNGSCKEYADPVTLRQIYLTENREWFKGVPGRNGDSDTTELGLVNAFCGQNAEVVVNICPARMRETKRFGYFF